jgi:tRNA pseudouridine55 synthase
LLSRASTRQADRVDGILLLDKPSGPSSNQALQRAKRLLCARKAGHAGTLDPLATGLLPVLFGEATKFASYLANAYKTYEADLLLGVTTSSGDVTGEVLARRPVDVTPDRVTAVLADFVGEVEQIPPMHSAIKQAGVPLYKLAHRGETVERPPRKIVIDELTLLRAASDQLTLRVRCSKGTYVRVLAEDIGEVLGCGATLSRLRRTSVGTFGVGRALTFEELEGLEPADRLERLLTSDAGLAHVPAVHVSPDVARLLYQGQQVGLETTADGLVRVYATEGGAFLGLGQVDQGRLRSVRLVNRSDRLLQNETLP